MSLRETLDKEIDTAIEVLGEVTQITLYKDKYEQLCQEMGQPEIHIYRGLKVIKSEETLKRE